MLVLDCRRSTLWQVPMLSQKYWPMRYPEWWWFGMGWSVFGKVWVVLGVVWLVSREEVLQGVILDVYL